MENSLQNNYQHFGCSQTLPVSLGSKLNCFAILCRLSACIAVTHDVIAVRRCGTEIDRHEVTRRRLYEQKVSSRVYLAASWLA